MLSNDRKQIMLLHPVRIDYNLKKWRPEVLEEALGNKTIDSDKSFGQTPTPDFEFSLNNQNVWDGVPFAVRRDYANPLHRDIAELYIRFRKVFTKPQKSPDKLFKQLKDNFQELEGKNISDEQLEKIITNLEKTRQALAVRQLKAQKSLADNEKEIKKAGFKQYQTEETMIKFIKQCKKGLCLVELENFERVIPEKVLEKFDIAEGLKMFDNYYILFYDPKQGDNPFYTKDKDPILFGVIRGSDKFYFIADWIDEHDNLTYNDILNSKGGQDLKL